MQIPAHEKKGLKARSHHGYAMQRSHRLKRGSALVLVMVAVALATVIGVTFLNTARMSTQVTRIIDDHAQARQIADSGLHLAVSYLERTPNWRESMDNGVWVSQFPLHGGEVTIEAQYDPTPPVTSIPITNHSFESGTGMLSDGILGLVLPQLSGTIQGWSVSRAGLLGGLTSATVPTTGIVNSGLATDGGRIANVVFKVGALAEAKFSRTVAYELEPNTTYTLMVDIGKAGVLDLLPSHSLRLKAGGQTYQGTDGQLLVLLDLDGNFATRAIRFTTGDAPPAGNVTIELYAVTLVGVIQGIGFDNVKLLKEKPSPITLTVTATHGGTSHVVRATIMPRGQDESAWVIDWADP